MKKYEFTGESKTVNGVEVKRIRAIKAFGSTKSGSLGGWIESERNLSQEDNCWVADNACAYGNAIIRDNARLYENAIAYGNAVLSDGAVVTDKAEVYGNAHAGELARIDGSAKIFGNAYIVGRARVGDNARVGGSAIIGDEAIIEGVARVYGSAKVSGDTLLVDGNYHRGIYDTNEIDDIDDYLDELYLDEDEFYREECNDLGETYI